MEKAPDDGGSGGGGGGGGSEPLPYKTWMLRVSIHCGGCRKKVKKVLQSIEGVYKIEIDSKQHKVVVTGDVESGTLIKKLIRSGKAAELWPENEGAGGGGDDGERKTDGPTKDNSAGDRGDSSGEDHAEDKGAPPAQGGGGGGGGGGGKKKKKKKKKKGNAGGGGAQAPAPVDGGGGGGVPPDAAPVDQTNENPPRQHVFTYPQFYRPGPEYGMSNNTAALPMATSHYTLPVYYPTHSHFDPTVVVHRYEDHHGDYGIGCSIM